MLAEIRILRDDKGRPVEAKKINIKRQLPRIWIGLVAIVLLWQVVTYRGLAALAAEWQFNELGNYHPAITFLLLLLLFSSPVLIWKWFSRSRRDEGEVAETRRLNRSISATTAFRSTLLAITLVAICAAIVIGIVALLLPSDQGSTHRVVVKTTDAPPSLGPTDLQGQVLYGKLALTNKDLLIMRTSTRFAPIVEPGASQTDFRYFIEVSTSTPPATADQVVIRHGVLRKAGLPGELVRLYRYAGFTIEPDYYVLFQSGASMRQPYFIDMTECLVFAIFLAIIAQFASMRTRRLEREMAKVNTPVTV